MMNGKSTLCGLKVIAKPWLGKKGQVDIYLTGEYIMHHSFVNIIINSQGSDYIAHQ